jgi:hypothetical protein
LRRIWLKNFPPSSPIIKDSSKTKILRSTEEILQLTRTRIESSFSQIDLGILKREMPPLSKKLKVSGLNLMSLEKKIIGTKKRT